MALPEDAAGDEQTEGRQKVEEYRGIAKDEKAAVRRAAVGEALAGATMVVEVVERAASDKVLDFRGKLVQVSLSVGYSAGLEAMKAGVSKLMAGIFEANPWAAKAGWLWLDLCSHVSRAL